MKFSHLFSAVAAAAMMSFSAHADEGDAQKLADKWTEAYNDHDVDALGALYTEGAHLYLHGTPMLIGRDNITTFWSGDMEDGNPKTVLSVTNIVEGFDMTLVHGDYQVINRDTDEVEGQGRFAHIWIVSEDGEWRLDRDLWNQPFEEWEEEEEE